MQLKWPMRWDLFSLFPAYAGVIPGLRVSDVLELTFPRIRGGDPNSRTETAVFLSFSPHTRG